jgi:hypothetical protein
LDIKNQEVLQTNCRNKIFGVKFMTTHVEQLAAQIRQLSSLERQQLLALIPEFDRIDVPLSNTTTRQFKSQNNPYQFIAKRLGVTLIDNQGATRRVERNL